LRDGEDTPDEVHAYLPINHRTASLTGYADPDGVSGSGFERGIDQDISASRDTGATNLRDLSLRRWKWARDYQWSG
jgi:hypothetical protein